MRKVVAHHLDKISSQAGCIKQPLNSISSSLNTKPSWTDRESMYRRRLTSPVTSAVPHHKPSIHHNTSMYRRSVTMTETFPLSLPRVALGYKPAQEECRKANSLIRLHFLEHNQSPNLLRNRVRNSVFLGPFSCSFYGALLVLLPALRHIWSKGIVRIGSTEESLNREKYGTDL